MAELFIHAGAIFFGSGEVAVDGEEQTFRTLNLT
jgi:hypothetical protein